MQRMGARLGAIALLAMLVRAVVPAGYMLAQAEDSSGRHLTVQMCVGHAMAATQVIDLDTGKAVDKPEKPRGEAKHAPCVFAGAAHLAPPIAIAEPFEFVFAVDVDFSDEQGVRPGRGIPAPPPPATGPPATI